jgi:hypothetical protein
MWPAFLLATAVDAVIVHVLPFTGESQRLVGAALLACFINLIVIVVLARPLGSLVRRLRPDLPRVVVHDYAGTIGIVGITIAFLVLGLAHRSTLQAHKKAMGEAISRAQAWIGDRAPAEFRRHVGSVSTYVIEPGSIYRTCVPSDKRPRTYCVVVKVRLPMAQSVTFDGYESNQVFSAGAE